MSNLNKVAFELCWIVLGFDNGPKRPKNDTDFGLFVALNYFYYLSPCLKQRN